MLTLLTHVPLANPSPQLWAALTVVPLLIVTALDNSGRAGVAQGQRAAVDGGAAGVAVQREEGQGVVALHGQALIFR